jgi:hypothetical protein
MSNQTVNFLRTLNRWRRGDQNLEQPCPRVVGQMIDAVCDEVETLTQERDEARIQYRSTLALAEVLANTQVKLKAERDEARALLEASK